MKLVICEKNIAARRIAFILSGGQVKNSHLGKIPVYSFTKDNEPWTIIGLKGHIINLDYPSGFNQWTKIPPSQLIEVEPCKKVSEKGIASALKTLVEDTPYLIVATDFDREGELIGVEVVNLLKSYNPDIIQIKRARYSAITPYEINTAFDNLTEVDYNLSNAGEARQVIDLVWGAVLTRFISLTSRRLGRDFLSIGRVQSPTLAILVEREKEIKIFNPKPYWTIVAQLKKDRTIDATHEHGVFREEQPAQEIYQKIKESKDAFVKEVKKVSTNETPPAPFNTTTYIQAASYLGFTAVKAMSIAEELYMQGLTSYPRTDNTVYPPSLNINNILQKLSTAHFAKEVQEIRTNGRDYPTRGKQQTTDHPPIHPVDAPSKKLGADQEKIYELICRDNRCLVRYLRREIHYQRISAYRSELEATLSVFQRKKEASPGIDRGGKTRGSKNQPKARYDQATATVHTRSIDCENGTTLPGDKIYPS
jgi:DNA topoisomerase-1